MAERLIELPRSIIPACDVATLEELDRLVSETADVEKIGGYKVGLELALTYGLPEVNRIAAAHTDKPVIYDHQKAGNDIPDLGAKFARVVAQSGVKSAILFPFASAKTERDWIEACQTEGLVVIVGGHMTQAEFLDSEGGFIANNAPARIYTIAAENGVRDFVVPGNKVEFVKMYKDLLDRLLGPGNYTLYAPGFVAQGGKITDMGEVAGRNWHAIVGRDIYGAENIRGAAIQSTSQI